MRGDDETILLDSTLFSTVKYLSADGPDCRDELFFKDIDCTVASPV